MLGRPPRFSPHISLAQEHVMRVRFASACLLWTFALGSSPFAQTLASREIASGFDRPIWVGAPSGDDRIFVAEQTGRIKVVDGGSVSTFLDLSTAILNGSERGLLGVAFHPSYASNGFFFVNYTATGTGATTISRFTVSAGDPNLAEPTSELVILTESQPLPEPQRGRDLLRSAGRLPLHPARRRRLRERSGLPRAADEPAPREGAADRRRLGQPLRDPARQPVRRRGGCAARDLPLRRAQPLARRLRSPDG